MNSSKLWLAGKYDRLGGGPRVRESKGSILLPFNDRKLIILGGSPRVPFGICEV